MTLKEFFELRIELTRPKKNSSEDSPRKKTEDEVFEGMIELLKSKQELDDYQTEYLKSRLVNQIVYMDSKSNKCKKQYIKSQMTSIIGGVVVTALVGLSTFIPPEKDGIDMRKFFGITAFIVSQVVTVTNAVEQLHKNNELWLFYRRSNEYMKSQLWHFLELTGPYENIKRDTAFRILVKQSEEIIPRDLDILSAKSKENNISANPEPDNNKETQGTKPT